MLKYCGSVSVVKYGGTISVVKYGGRVSGDVLWECCGEVWWDY